MSTDPAAKTPRELFDEYMAAGARVVAAIESTLPPPSPAQSAGSKEEQRAYQEYSRYAEGVPGVDIRVPVERAFIAGAKWQREQPSPPQPATELKQVSQRLAAEPDTRAILSSLAADFEETATEQERGEKPMQWPSDLTTLIGRKITHMLRAMPDGLPDDIESPLEVVGLDCGELAVMDRGRRRRLNTNIRDLLSVDPPLSPPPETVKQAEWIKRYTMVPIGHSDKGMAESETGPWVLHKDHTTHVAALESELRKVREATKELATYAACSKLSNQPDFMRGLAERITVASKILGYPTTMRFDKRDGIVAELSPSTPGAQ